MVSGEFEEAWHARYDRWATKYDREHQIAGWSEAGLNRRLALVLHLLRAGSLEPGSQILDLGAGPGTYMRHLTALGHRCLGVDYSGKVIKFAKAKDPHGQYVQAEAYHLPFDSAAFEAVICIGVLQSLQLIQQAVDEMCRVLKPGGYLILDGLSSPYWLHQWRAWSSSVWGREKEMSYVNPSAIVGVIKTLGFSDSQIYWLLMPQTMQSWLRIRSQAATALLPRLFGYAFLIFAKKALC